MAGSRPLPSIGARVIGAGVPAPQESDPRVGASAFIGGSWFQYLGRDPSEDRPGTSDRLWLYPHLDGVYEIFREGTPNTPWQGQLGSVFDRQGGRFRMIFSAPEVLNLMLRAEPSPGRSRRAARLLELFKTLHGGETPYYLLPSEKRARRKLKEADRRWVADRVAFYQRVTSRVETLGPRVFRDLDSLRSSDDYYRAMVSDGYLDIVVVGGNSFDEDTNRVYSRQTILDLRKELGAQGFRPVAQAGDDDCPNEEKITSFFGQPIRIRIRASGASSKSHRIRRTVCHFVEGLAHADVVIYHGHSNRKTGTYYLSESRSKFSRFKIGLHSQRDLDRKCHGLAQKPYQVLALQSCYSFEKYCLPVEDYYDRELSRRPGVMGNTHFAYFVDFVPRYSEFVRLLARGAGPRELSQRLNAIRPLPGTPALLMRGMFQPRGTFIVPAGVEVTRREDRGPKASFQHVGWGDDRREYVSTDTFPQDEPGEIVQVVGYDRGAFGLDRDGRLWHYDRRSQGAAVVIADPNPTHPPFRFIVQAKDPRGRDRLTVLDAEGSIRHWRPYRGETERPGAIVKSSYDRKRGAFKPVAIGPVESENVPTALGFGGCDAEGRFFLWNRKEGWAPVEEPARFTAKVTPHLAQGGTLFFTP